MIYEFGVKVTRIMRLENLLYRREQWGKAEPTEL